MIQIDTFLLLIPAGLIIASIVSKIKHKDNDANKTHILLTTLAGIAGTLLADNPIVIVLAAMVAILGAISLYYVQRANHKLYVESESAVAQYSDRCNELIDISTDVIKQRDALVEKYVTTKE